MARSDHNVYYQTSYCVFSSRDIVRIKTVSSPTPMLHFSSTQESQNCDKASADGGATPLAAVSFVISARLDQRAPPARLSANWFPETGSSFPHSGRLRVM